MDIAPFIGLQRYSQANEIETFHVHRSRMPTALFRSIVEDLDVMLLQYGPPIEHKTEQATSRFLSPVSTEPLFHLTTNQLKVLPLRYSIALLLYSALPSVMNQNRSSKDVSLKKAG